MNVLQYLTENKDQILRDIEWIVTCESPSRRKDLSDECADAIYQMFYERLGVYGEAYEQEETGKHLKFEIGRGDKTVVMLAHYDTVWEEGDLSYYIEGDKAYGPGTVDMKAGLVQSMWAIKALQELDVELDYKIKFLVTADEEIKSPTGQYFIKDEAKDADVVLVVEPPTGYEGLIKTERKGDATYDIKAIGVASHAGNDPKPQANAINELAHQIVKLENLADLENGTSINVGVIHGGSKRNVTAAEAVMEVDCRFSKREEAHRIDEAIQALKPTLKETDLVVEGEIGRYPMERTEQTVELYEMAKEVASDLGMEIGETFAGGVSDGNFTSAMGIPTLDGLGAIGDGLHAPHEHIVISELPRRGALLAGVLEKLNKS
ncbi:glutamate carboxypeptidase [Alkalibacillus filiformis]|uniref:Glutamate carboxypeptidase n=1 Tax=Alkalibacillus filiformis TaxID=200990 RepID=A0ABU0DX11_9BACI|nr:M20 family metallopeptidase [Alkalibacillus filiformis]MDQ0353014.1 glutamate carboxypeptidase [Alkalibacillus filiformis]